MRCHRTGPPDIREHAYLHFDSHSMLPSYAPLPKKPRVVSDFMALALDTHATVNGVGHVSAHVAQARGGGPRKWSVAIRSRSAVPFGSASERLILRWSGRGAHHQIHAFLFECSFEFECVRACVRAPLPRLPFSVVSAGRETDRPKTAEIIADAQLCAPDLRCNWSTTTQYIGVSCVNHMCDASCESTAYKVCACACVPGERDRERERSRDRGMNETITTTTTHRA